MTFNFNRNMKKGMRGSDISNLQTLLNTNGFDCGKVDGIFGSKTLKAVKAAQKAHHLKVDGIAGKNTVTALGATWGLVIDPITKDYIKICTFNVKRGTYKKGSYKIIGNLVKEFDIVGLQEVTPSGFKKIASYADKTAHMCETITNYGHGILTNFEHTGETITTLKASGERRKLHNLDFGDVAYYNTHFHYTESANEKQMQQLIDILKKDTHKTIIVTGDFNRQEYGELTKLGFSQANTGQAIEDGTNNRTDIVNKIDNIFVKGGRFANVYKYSAVAKQYSDHDALMATIMIG